MEQGAGRTGCVGHDPPDSAQHSTAWFPQGMTEPTVTSMRAFVTAVRVRAHVQIASGWSVVQCSM